MGTVILQQLSGRFLAIWDLLWHLPLFWDALSALPLMWPSLGDTLVMPDLALLEFTALVMPQLLLLPQPLSLPQLPTELSTTPPAPLSPMPQLHMPPPLPLPLTPLQPRELE